MKYLALIVTVLWATLASATYPSRYCAEFFADPASATAACVTDATNLTAIQNFPYWNQRGNTWGRFFLGVAQGYMWMITCEHCGHTDTVNSFSSGPYSGVSYIPVANDGGTGSYFQFFTRLGYPMGDDNGNTRGDLLYRMVRQDGAAYPAVSFVNVLTDELGLPDGTLMLTLGRGDFTAHSTLGWYEECCYAVGCGNPVADGTDTSNDACCSDTPRTSNQFDAPGTTGEATRQPNSSTVITGTKAGWGGEGTVSTCDVAGLSYLGPVWVASTAWSWNVWVYRQSDFSNQSCTGGSCPAYEGNVYAKVSLSIAEGSTDAEHCIDIVGSGANFREVDAPDTRWNEHHYCGTATGPATGGGLSNVNHDSGSPTFAYVNGTWLFAGSGQHGTDFNFHTIKERHVWNHIIHGTDLR